MCAPRARQAAGVYRFGQTSLPPDRDVRRAVLGSVSKLMPGVGRLLRSLAASTCIADALGHRLLWPPCQRTLRSVLGPQQIFETKPRVPWAIDVNRLHAS